MSSPSSSSTEEPTSSTTPSPSSSTSNPPPPPPTSSSSSSPPPPPPPTTSPTSTKSNPPPPTSSSPSPSKSNPPPPPSSSSSSSPSPSPLPSNDPTSPTQSNSNSSNPLSSSPSGSTDGPLSSGSSLSPSGSVTPVTSSGVGTTSSSNSLSPPHGAGAPGPVTAAVSTRIITTTQPGGEVVTLTTTLANPTLSTNTLVGHSSVNTRAIAAASTIGGLAVLSLIGWIIFAYRRKRRRDDMERDSATAAMMAAGILHPPFIDTPNQTPMNERGHGHGVGGGHEQYFEDGTPITSIISEPLPGVYPAYTAIPRTSSNGTNGSGSGTGTGTNSSTFNSRQELIGHPTQGATRSPSLGSAAIYSPVSTQGYNGYEPTSRSHSPPGSLGATTYPPTAAFNVRRSMRSASSSDDSHSQGHASLLQSFPPAFHLPPTIPPKNGNGGNGNGYSYPHTYPSGISPAGSLPGSGSSHEGHDNNTTTAAKSVVNQPLLLPNTTIDMNTTTTTTAPPTPYDDDDNYHPSMAGGLNRQDHLMLGTPTGIPVSSSEISLGYGNNEGGGYTSVLLSRPRLEVRNKTGSFRTGSDELNETHHKALRVLGWGAGSKFTILRTKIILRDPSILIPSFFHIIISQSTLGQKSNTAHAQDCLEFCGSQNSKKMKKKTSSAMTVRPTPTFSHYLIPCQWVMLYVKRSPFIKKEKREIYHPQPREKRVVIRTINGVLLPKELATTTTFQGPANPKDMVKIRLSFPPNNQTALAARIMAATVPGSKQFGQHPTKQEVDALVAPNPEINQVVNSWLKNNNIPPSSSTSTRNQIQLSLTVQQANDLFQTNIGVFNNTLTGETSVSAQNVSVPSKLLVGNSFINVQIGRSGGRGFGDSSSNSSTSNHDVQAIVSGIISGNCTSSSVFPACLQSSYNIPPIPTLHPNNSIAITGFQPPQQSDIQAFLTDFRPDLNASALLSNPPVISDVSSTSEEEADSEFEYVIALAPSVNTSFYSIDSTSMNGFIDLVQSLLDNEDPPKVLSTSLGFNEADIPQDTADMLCQDLMQLTARGVTLIVATGDGGVAGEQPSEEQQCTSFQVTFPASCPWVTAVGSTSGIPEVGANFTNGGFSNYFTTPPYQHILVREYLHKLGTTNMGLFNPKGRGIPDIVVQGTNLPSIIGGDLQLGSGTSFSASIVAAIVAHLNGGLLAAGRSPIGFLNPTLYYQSGVVTDITNDVEQMGFRRRLAGIL
ncbi:hypothetical protein Clacol_004168 [Clathrus columnatus]|uniref:Peptidase S53 domain-containing protein n=1 Tax=Clathrus columnatus TaxID=1419009 RepID=A0AAV5A5P6_9AGAM|nr:hypothetical protein Clacol_004168 [Clathrus columnatus]